MAGLEPEQGLFAAPVSLCVGRFGGPPAPDPVPFHQTPVCLCPQRPLQLPSPEFIHLTTGNAQLGWIRFHLKLKLEVTPSGQLSWRPCLCQSKPALPRELWKERGGDRVLGGRGLGEMRQRPETKTQVGGSKDKLRNVSTDNFLEDYCSKLRPYDLTPELTPALSETSLPTTSPSTLFAATPLACSLFLQPGKNSPAPRSLQLLVPSPREPFP